MPPKMIVNNNRTILHNKIALCGKDNKFDSEVTFEHHVATLLFIIFVVYLCCYCRFHDEYIIYTFSKSYYLASSSLS